MKRALIIAAVIAAVVVAWLVGGRQLVLLADQFATEGETKPVLSPIIYSPSLFSVDNVPLFLTPPAGLDAELIVVEDDTGRIVLNLGGKIFVLGKRGATEAGAGPYDVAIVPDLGDTVTLRFSHSLFAWPTPLELNFITGNSPSWKRHTYYTLTWGKMDGATLEMTWRYEQWFYDDWASPMMTHQGVSGLISARISKHYGIED